MKILFSYALLHLFTYFFLLIINFLSCEASSKMAFKFARSIMQRHSLKLNCFYLHSLILVIFVFFFSFIMQKVKSVFIFLISFSIFYSSFSLQLVAFFICVFYYFLFFPSQIYSYLFRIQIDFSPTNGTPSKSKSTQSKLLLNYKKTKQENKQSVDIWEYEFLLLSSL